MFRDFIYRFIKILFIIVFLFFVEDIFYVFYIIDFIFEEICLNGVF